MDSSADRTTRTVHVPIPDAGGSIPLSVPLYQTSSYAFEDPETLAEALLRPDRGFAYSRFGNPTTRALEEAVAGLEGGTGGLATSSGMAAVNLVLLGLLSAGDHVVAQRRLYGGTATSLQDLTNRFGVAVSYVDGHDEDELRHALRPNTTMLYLETIANPMTRVVDVPALTSIARSAGAITVVDNTFASPLLCRPIEHGADIVLHSATKYLGGHSDVVGGVVVSADDQTHHRLWRRLVDFGMQADPFAAWLTIRGLKTLSVRMEKQCANARVLAERLADHPAVSTVYWPGLVKHPDHDVARRILSDYGGLLAFDLAGGLAAAQDLLRRVRLVRSGVSLGGVETLAMHPASTSHRDMSGEELRAMGIGDGTIRLAVGIEHPDDLWADLATALG
jgi:cystathionine beta-lyase/cystathionine gamma-synthase